MSSLYPQQHFLAKPRLCSRFLPLDLTPELSGKKLCPGFHSCCWCGGCVSSCPSGSMLHVGLKAGPDPGKAGGSLESQNCTWGEVLGSLLPPNSVTALSIPPSSGWVPLREEATYYPLKGSLRPNLTTRLLATSLAWLRLLLTAPTSQLSSHVLITSLADVLDPAVPPSYQSPGPVNSASYSLPTTPAPALSWTVLLTPPSHRRDSSSHSLLLPDRAGSLPTQCTGSTLHCSPPASPPAKGLCECVHSGKKGEGPVSLGGNVRSWGLLEISVQSSSLNRTQ